MNLDLIICFGKSLYKNTDPDWILKSRLKKTIEVALDNPNSKIILTGGKSHLIEEDVEISEADAMLDYIKKHAPNLVDRILIEDKGDSTVHQLIKIKTEIISSQNYKRVGLVTDEIHIKRVVPISKKHFW